jgi:predicted nicotinamide N-methyase
MLIGRIRFFRSILSRVSSRAQQRCEIYCCSEFGESLECESLIEFKNYRVELRHYACNSILSDVTETWTLDCSNGTLQMLSTSRIGVTALKFLAPQNIGFYSLYVEYKSSESALSVLSLESDLFAVVESVSKINFGSSSALPLLACHRRVSLDGCSVIVKEDYGDALGSHVYDSSIVLLNYLHSNPKFCLASTSPKKSVLELGAGCGLVGLWLSKWMSNKETLQHNFVHCEVYLTDKQCQLPLLQHNVGLNFGASGASSSNLALLPEVIPLDWSCEGDVFSFKQKMDSNLRALELIVAGDVFYDKNVAALFFNIVRSVGMPGVTKILVAQKLRPIDSKGTVFSALISADSIRSEPGFSSIDIVHEEANVLIWSLSIA